MNLLNLFFSVDNPQTWLSLYAFTSIIITSTILYARLNINISLSDQIFYYMGNIPDRMINSHNVEILRSACMWCFSPTKQEEIAKLMNCSMCDLNNTDVHTNVSYVSVKDLQKAIGDNSNPMPSQEEDSHAKFTMALAVMLFYSLNAFWKQVRVLKESRDGRVDDSIKRKRLSKISPIDNSPGKLRAIEDTVGRRDKYGDGGDDASMKLNFNSIE